MHLSNLCKETGVDCYMTNVLTTEKAFKIWYMQTPLVGETPPSFGDVWGQQLYHHSAVGCR